MHTHAPPTPPCPLCQADLPPNEALVLAQAAKWRVVRALDAPGFPAFYRVIWMAHVREMDELARADQHALMDVVNAIAAVLRRELMPSKLNLASLGNVVPHLHWHVIARFDWDSHYPSPIWAEARRLPREDTLQSLRAALPELDAAVARAVACPTIHA